MINKTNNNIIEYIISEESKGLRVDQAISKAYEEYSRTLIQKWIKKEKILVNGKTTRAKNILSLHDKITIFPEEKISTDEIIPENIKIDINFEDEDLLVIEKNINIVSHPADSVKKGTIANGLVYKFPELINLPRAGLIHRLDKDTTGLLIVAKNLKSYKLLTQAMQNRQIKKNYIAYVHGQIMKNDTINKPISRHKTNRKKMAVNLEGKEAITSYEVLQNFNFFTKLKINLLTGRTHQIRVHMNFLGYPLIGDQTYGLNPNKCKSSSNYIKKFSRQALHADKLEFFHPILKKRMILNSSLPKDLAELQIEINKNE